MLALGCYRLIASKMKTIAALLLFTALVSSSSTTRKSYPSISRMEWLLGLWQSSQKGNATFEHWVKANDSTFYGRSYIVKAKDTLTLERIILQERLGKLYYEPTVSEQNNGASVCFVAAMLNDTTAIFENRQHDFPTTICYSKVSADSLVAYIEGMQGDKQKRIVFRMKRVRN